MNLIVAVDKNWGIGYKNELLARIPEDLSFFRRMTEGKIVVYGRKTLETFPNKAPLKGRTNVVISSNESFYVEGAIVVHSVNELLKYLKTFDCVDIFVIGGASVYAQLLSYCDTAYVTKIDKEYKADAYFPNLDEKKEWILGDSTDMVCQEALIKFTTYHRIETA